MTVVDSGLAHLSDGLFTTAIATYALAMASYTAEYAFGRRGRVAVTSAVEEPARVLVGAGGPPASADDAVLAARSVPGGPFDQNHGPEPAGQRSSANRFGRFAVALTV